MIPVLWAMYLYSTIHTLAIMLALAAITDVIDGHMARKLNMQTEYGSKLDSVADNLLALSVIFWTFRIYPGIFENHSSLIILWSVLLILSGLIGIVKFGRIGNLHLYSSKAAAVLSYLFVVHAYLFQYSPALFYISITALIVSALEIIFIQILSTNVDEHMGSVLIRR